MCGTMVGSPGAPKTIQTKYKRTNSDQRKEKSRDAARDRRAKEHQLFQDLEDSLPMSGVADTTQTAMDKTSLIRLTVAHLKCRNVVDQGLVIPEEDGKDVMEDKEMLESMDAFCLVLSQEMDIIYVSNNVANQIGLTSMELLGQSFYDYIHPCDHHQLNAVLNPKGGQSKEAYVRIKVTVTERGRLINLRQANYKVLKISGIARSFERGSDGGLDETVFLGLAQLIVRDSSPQSNNMIHTGVFQTKHSPDMKFLETDAWLSTVAQYPPHHINGMSFYEFIHAEECQKVQKSLKNLCEQGQCETAPYRFLVAGGGWVWIQTRANQTVARKGSSKGCTISCTHTAISEVMNKGEVVALVQISPESMENKNTGRKQKNENLNTMEIEKVEIIEDAKPFEDLYDVLQTLDESQKEGVNFVDLLDILVTQPTPSVIVTPNANTENIMRRPSVIVTSKSATTIAEKTEDLSFQEPRAVTTIILQNTDEPEVDSPIAELTFVQEDEDKQEQIEIQIDDGAYISLSNCQFIMDELDEVIQIAPFCNELVKIEDEQPGFIKKEQEPIPVFDFCDDSVKKQPKTKVIQNNKDYSEDFFRIMEETTTPPKENSFADCNRKNGDRNPFVREDKKIMWGLNNEDPELESYLYQFSNKFIKAPPAALPNFSLASALFNYDPYQEENKTMNPVWDSVVYNPPTNKPLPPPKMWINQQEMLNRKRTAEHQNSIIQMTRKAPATLFPEQGRLQPRKATSNAAPMFPARKTPFSAAATAPLFPELQKFLEGQSPVPIQTYENIYIMNGMENAKRIRMDSYMEPKNVILVPKN